MIANASMGAAYGWRARVGFLMPAIANQNHSHEFYLMAPDGVALTLASLGSLDDPPGGAFSPGGEGLNRLVRRIPAGVQLLASQDVNVIGAFGVPHIVMQGWGFEEKLQSQINKLTKIPFIIDIRACVNALQALQASQVLMVSPFTDEWSEQITEYVRQSGINVVGAHKVAAEYGPIGRIPLGSLYQIVKTAAKATGKVDGIWLPGAGMSSVAIIDSLEEDLGVAVVSSKQAVMWASLLAANVAAPVVGYGKLFQL